MKKFIAGLALVGAALVGGVVGDEARAETVTLLAKEHLSYSKQIAVSVNVSVQEYSYTLPATVSVSGGTTVTVVEQTITYGYTIRSTSYITSYITSTITTYLEMERGATVTLENGALQVGGFYISPYIDRELVMTILSLAGAVKDNPDWYSAENVVFWDAILRGENDGWLNNTSRVFVLYSHPDDIAYFHAQDGYLVSYTDTGEVGFDLYLHGEWHSLLERAHSSVRGER